MIRMYIVHVIPFAKSLRKESLSYFSLKNIPVGSIVTIDLRKKIVQGLVIEVESGDKLKEELKTSKFKLRKVKGVNKNVLIRREFITAVSKTAEYFAASKGQVFQILIPSKVLEEIKKLKEPNAPKKFLDDGKNAKYIIQDQYSERYSSYKNLIREEFAKKRSVLFICPTIEDVAYAKKLLSKGIEENTFTFDSRMTAKQIIKEWNSVIEHKKQVLIIATGVFLGIPRHDIGSIVIEKESSSIYKTQKTPHVDIRIVAEHYATAINARFFLGDLMLRAETLWRYDENEFYEYGSLKFRSLSSAKQLIIDMKRDRSNQGEVFSIFSNEAIDIIKQTRENNQNTFFFAGRKGLAPTIICGDCGTVVTCNKCKAPVVLHGKDATDQGNYFKCHVCGDERSAGEKCSYCTSWKLNTLGIGTETVAKELEEKFPENKFFILTSDSAKTPKQAREIIEKFYETPGSILIGTEMAILYLHKPVENAVVVTIDALLGIPDFAIRERILRILLQIRSRANHNFFIQTRKVDDKIFDYAKRGNLADFYREEFRDRNQFHYPPFSTIIKISILGTRSAVTKEFENLKEYFKPFELLTYQSFRGNRDGKFSMNGIIRLKRGDWINEELQKKLEILPPQIKVVVDADSLL